MILVLAQGCLPCSVEEFISLQLEGWGPHFPSSCQPGTTCSTGDCLQSFCHNAPDRCQPGTTCSTSDCLQSFCHYAPYRQPRKWWLTFFRQARSHLSASSSATSQRKLSFFFFFNYNILLQHQQRSDFWSWWRSGSISMWNVTTLQFCFLFNSTCRN